jgi:hypothetical protein
VRNIPVHLKAAALSFFFLGLLAVPIASVGDAGAAYYKITFYLVAALFFWIWLHRDATSRRLSWGWQVLVGVGWLFAAIPVVPAYLLFTRGWKQGLLAVTFFFAIVLGLFGVFGLGVFLSTQVTNAFFL